MRFRIHRAALALAAAFACAGSPALGQPAVAAQPADGPSRDAQCYMATSIAFALVSRHNAQGQPSPENRTYEDQMEAAWMFYMGRVSASVPPEAVEPALREARETLTRDVSGIANSCKADFLETLGRIGAAGGAALGQGARQR